MPIWRYGNLFSWYRDFLGKQTVVEEIPCFYGILSFIIMSKNLSLLNLFSPKNVHIVSSVKVCITISTYLSV
jgi:hypothetical protein